MTNTKCLVIGGMVTGAYCAKTLVTDFVSSMSASADVLALGKKFFHLRNDLFNDKIHQ